MTYILLIISIILIITGIVASFVPIIPGPITGWFGLFALSQIHDFYVSNTLLIITFIVAITIFIVDYFIPVIGSKYFGGSKYGVIGTSIGLLVGLLSPIPFGIIIGPFIGAFIGEMINNNDSKVATKAAFGSFLGFLTSTFLKFVVAVVYLGLFIMKVVEYSGNLF